MPDLHIHQAALLAAHIVAAAWWQAQPIPGAVAAAFVRDAALQDEDLLAAGMVVFGHLGARGQAHEADALRVAVFAIERQDLASGATVLPLGEPTA